MTMSRWKSGRVALLAFALTVAMIQPPVDGTPAPQDEYVFVRLTERPVSILRGGYVLIGKLDADGNFIQDAKRKGSGLEPSNLTPPILNYPHPEPVPAYEYRSGRLVKGELGTKGVFVPEVGSKVIRFEDYKYRPGGIGIWNLPGYFKEREKEKPAAKKDEKK
jgi:hypothetical protein